MSEDQLRAFLEAVKADPLLQGRLKAAKDIESIIEIAKEANFMLEKELIERANAEISPEEIEGLHGGNLASSDTCTQGGCGLGCYTFYTPNHAC